MAVKTGLDGLVLARTTFHMTSPLEPWWTVVVAVEAEEMCIFAGLGRVPWPPLTICRTTQW